MATLRDLRARIKGVKNTQQITKAMKMVAAAKLRRAQENILNARPYARKISEMTVHLVSESDRNTNPLLVEKPVKNALVIVVTADRGLCGAFNTNIIKEATNHITQLQSEGASVALYCIGRKGYEHFKKRDYEIFDFRINVVASINHEFTGKIAEQVVTAFIGGKFEKATIIYNEFKSVIAQRIVNEEFLPIKVNSAKEQLSDDLFIYEPSQSDIFTYILPRNLEAQLWRVTLESVAAELGAKMTAMENATTNASEMIKTLSTKYNRERQALITKEILEIVSGANALQSN